MTSSPRPPTTPSAASGPASRGIPRHDLVLQHELPGSGWLIHARDLGGSGRPRGDHGPGERPESTGPSPTTAGSSSSGWPSKRPVREQRQRPFDRATGGLEQRSRSGHLQLDDDQYDKGYLYYSGAQGGDSWARLTRLTGPAGRHGGLQRLRLRSTPRWKSGFTTVASFCPVETGWTGNLIGGARCGWSTAWSLRSRRAP